MPQTLDHPMGAANYAPAPVRHPAPPEEEESMPSTDTDSKSKAAKRNWPLIILASGGTGAAATILAGSVVGPLGALGAGVIGILLGVLIQKSHKSKIEVHR